jgi:CubicO group peptidase (beta-lactamase class C family)
MSGPLGAALRQIDDWPVPTAAAAVVGPGGVLAAHGPTGRVFELASVTKLLAAFAALVAVEEGAVNLDDPVGDYATAGSTLRHLLAHTSGLVFDGLPASRRAVGRPGASRIYSNAGFEAMGEFISDNTEIPFWEYLEDAVFTELDLARTVLYGSPAWAARSTVDDLAVFAGELLRPTLLHPSTLAAATSVQFPGLPGVVPGFGRQDPNDWGLGFEIRDGKHPHWTGEHNSPATFGHFGRSGTFLWVDPDAGLACACLTDRAFDDWAAKLWPELSDRVLAEFTR